MMKRTRASQQNLEPKMDSSSEQDSHIENCMNPWNGKCLNTDISLYIMYKGNRLPICRKCWEVISSDNVEWMYD